MTVKRINITFDEDLYRKVKAICFIKQKPISEYIRESVISFMTEEIEKKAEEILSTKEESELLKLMKAEENQSYMTHEELKAKYQLS